MVIHHFSLFYLIQGIISECVVQSGMMLFLVALPIFEKLEAIGINQCKCNVLAFLCLCSTLICANFAFMGGMWIKIGSELRFPKSEQEIGMYFCVVILSYIMKKVGSNLC